MVRLLFALLTLPCFAADFSGTWKLVVAKSDFGKATAPQGQEITVKQTGDILAVHSALTDHRGETKSSYAIDATGKDVENVIRGNRVVSHAGWIGGVLIVKSETEVQNLSIRTSDEWQIDPDGKTLTIARVAKSPQGELRQRFVYEKALAKH